MICHEVCLLELRSSSMQPDQNDMVFPLITTVSTERPCFRYVVCVLRVECWVCGVCFACGMLDLVDGLEYLVSVCWVVWCELVCVFFWCCVDVFLKTMRVFCVGLLDCEFLLLLWVSVFRFVWAC